MILSPFSSFSLALLFALDARAPGPRITVSPARPEPGAIVRVTVSGAGDAAMLTGTMSGEALHFTRAADGTWHALGPVSADATGSLAVRAEVETNGVVDSLRASVILPAV